MIIVKTIVDNILDVCRGSADSGFESKVMRLINNKYFELCRKTSWRNLRTRLTLDFSASDEYGLWLPPDVFGVDMVRDTDGVEFIERDRADIEADEYAYKYYRYTGSTSPLLYDVDVAISQGGDSFTSVAVDALVAAGTSVEDEYVRFGTELGYYKITGDTSPYGIMPTYYGPEQAEGDIRVRPEETERMVILDASEDTLLDRSVYVDYWKAPMPLYRDSDFILLPSATVLELMVLRELPEAKALRPVSSGEIEDALAEAKRLNPMFARSGNPRDKHNNIFDFSTSRDFFSRRGSA